MTLPPFERRFLVLSAFALPLVGLALSLLKGWRGGVVALLTGLLVTADFLWLARGLRVAASPGATVPKGAARDAVLALGSRSLLLLLGLYAILKILPGEGMAGAVGIAVPLSLLVVAGLTGTRS